MEELAKMFLQWQDDCIQGDILRQLSDIIKALKTENLQLKSNAVSDLETLIEVNFIRSLTEFIEWGCSMSPTFQHFIELLEACQIMLLNICAQRERCWKLQKQSARAMVPYYFAANKINYERWGTLALLQMLN